MILTCSSSSTKAAAILLDPLLPDLPLLPDDSYNVGANVGNIVGSEVFEDLLLDDLLKDGLTLDLLLLLLVSRVGASVAEWYKNELEWS